MSSNTANFALPLLAQSQAQKHVAVNEALAILDSVAQLQLKSVSVKTPPTNPIDGQAYALPLGPTGAWAFKGGQVAVYCNGGWRFLAPQAGWQAYAKDEDRRYRYDGSQWQGDAITTTRNGAGTGVEVIEFDQSIGTGTRVTTSKKIPAYTSVMGVTARVVTQLSGGTLSSLSVGVPTSLDRYGTGFRPGANSWSMGLTGMPISYYEDTPLVLTASGGNFNGGKIRIAIHLSYLSVPRS